jgi:hypothetical protein
LVCRLGHCRSECASDRDCPPSARCYFAREVGVCELPAVDVCDTPGACVAPLVCRMGHCAQPCASSSECGGGVCAAGGCTAAAPDAGMVGDGGASRRATCASDADCAQNEQCSAVTDSAISGMIGVFYCRPTCAHDSECQTLVGPGSLCIDLAHAGGGGSANVCSLPCHPLGDDCAAGDTCRAMDSILSVERSTYETAVECDHAGPGALGSACGLGEHWRCAANSDCDSMLGCVLLCRNPVTGPSDCPAGTTCATWNGGSGPLFVDGAEYGTCRTP